MLKLFWKSLLVSPAILGAVLAIASNATATESASKTETLQTESLNFELSEIQPDYVAQSNDQLLEQMEQYGSEGVINNQGQVTNVNQLRDVEPTAWAYEALRSLVERYGCIVGYPDRTFRGDRALTRWEFAAGLNACLNVMERLIQEGIAVVREDLEKLKRLMQEFEAELAALGARVDNLEARVSFLEDNQFSTTTKLQGEVIFALSDTFGENSNGTRRDTQSVFQDRVRLNFNTSFTGQDRLVTRLSAGTGVLFGRDYRTTFADKDGRFRTAQYDNLQSPSYVQTWQITPSTDNDIFVDWLAYYAPVEISDNFVLNTYVAAWGGIWADFVPTLNPYFEDFDGGNGALSAFAQRNPIYNIGGGAGAGFSLRLGFLESLLGPTTLSAGYLGAEPNDPQPGNGIFNGDYAALAQLNFNLFNRVNLGFTYVNAYHSSESAIFGQGKGFTDNNVGTSGTPLANLSQNQLRTAFDDGTVDFDTTGSDYISRGVVEGPGPSEGFINDIEPFNFRQKVTNSVGGQLAVAITDWLSFSAFGTYTDVKLLGRGDAEIWTYGGGFAFPDLGKEGNLLGIFAGVQPYLSNVDLDNVNFLGYEDWNPVHVELFYRYQLNDNISLTPGVIWISKPSQAKQTVDEVIGTLRGTFTF
ncbi:Carbohydrate-selective porin OprB [Gloeothece citriformis PCC 7424]|uniref:Carbohydrate-selective porin OprB n=1 Tax=Gloeothece citriformis (strain PCC 7424) TaxID=65393 RepID=B7K8I2_GLOC7|nr:iron uptake porin [Gloeothece citriformis]ACK69942.1 Carbohydrate-selective porin OprB [Gloeothece citriformis PCC 7424]